MPSSEPGLLQALRGAGTAHGKTLVADWLRLRAGQVVPLLPAHGLAKPTLHDLGFDSMSAMELRHRIESELGVAIAAAEFGGTLTLAELADLVHQRVLLAAVSNPRDGGDNGDNLEEVVL